VAAHESRGIMVNVVNVVNVFLRARERPRLPGLEPILPKSVGGEKVHKVHQVHPGLCMKATSCRLWGVASEERGIVPPIAVRWGTVGIAMAQSSLACSKTKMGGEEKDVD
jgi:hypothetical protein